jgi:hypothetical protein
MNDKHFAQQIRSFRKEAAIALPGAVIVFLLMLWVGPVSMLYVGGMVGIGVLVTSIYVLSWKRQSVVLRLLALMIFLLGQEPLRAIAFPDLPVGQVNWTISIQSGAIVLAIMCTVILLYDVLIARSGNGKDTPT